MNTNAGGAAVRRCNDKPGGHFGAARINVLGSAIRRSLAPPPGPTTHTMTMDQITVTFPSRAAYEAAREAVAAAASRDRSDSDGPSIHTLDTQEALRALEAAR